jgi:hypothetical protein
MNKIEKISLSVDKFEELIEANAQLIKRYGMDLNWRLKRAEDKVENLLEDEEVAGSDEASSNEEKEKKEKGEVYTDKEGNSRLDLDAYEQNPDSEESEPSSNSTEPTTNSSLSKRIDPKFQKMINFYLDKYQQNWQKDKIEEDGAWGPKTQAALDFISSLYENKYKFKNTSDLSNLETLYNDFAASQQGGQEQQAAEPQAEESSANQYKEFSF